jgi:hypothetical protein
MSQVHSKTTEKGEKQSTLSVPTHLLETAETDENISKI